MYRLHYWPTPNGHKITMMLEELGAPYEIVPVNIRTGDQFRPESSSLRGYRETASCSVIRQWLGLVVADCGSARPCGLILGTRPGSMNRAGISKLIPIY